MVEAMKKMGEEIIELRFKEENMREKMKIENRGLKDLLQKKYVQLVTMASLAMGVIQCRNP